MFCEGANYWLMLTGLLACLSLLYIYSFGLMRKIVTNVRNRFPEIYSDVSQDSSSEGDESGDIFPAFSKIAMQTWAGRHPELRHLSRKCLLAYSLFLMPILVFLVFISAEAYIC